MSTRRQLLKRDHSWPPTEGQAVGAGAGGSHSPVLATPSHSIEALREKFNSPTRIVEPTRQELREKLARSPARSPSQEQQQQQQQLARRGRSPCQVEAQLTPKARGFSAPETKAADADLGLVAPRCEYYEQLTHKRPTTPTAKAATPYRPRLKRQSYSLDRGRARKRAVALSGATELPPLKPRNGAGIGAGAGGGGTVSAPGTPRVQRRHIKLSTELKICYDGDSEEEPKVSSCADIDLEAMPLPATPGERARSLPRSPVSTGIDSLALKQQQQMALALARTAGTAGTDQQQQEEEEQEATRGTHIIPVQLMLVDSGAAVAVQPAPEPEQLNERVQRIYEDACSYLQRQDQHDSMTPPAKSEEAHTPLPATYVSATSGIKLQRQESRQRTPAQSPCQTPTLSPSQLPSQIPRQTPSQIPSQSRPSCIPTPPPLPPPPQPALLLRHAKPGSAQDQQSREQRQSRRQGGIFGAEGESPLARQHEAHVEIAQLEAKYAHIQQSITEHLRQIDAYMENAKTALQRSVQATPTTTPTPPAAEPAKAVKAPLASAPNELWDMFSARQSPILAVESPLQAILRQIYCRAGGIQLQPKQQQEVCPLLPPMPAENVPIVERALEDLHRIAIALDSEGQQEPQQQLHVEHGTTPMAGRAQHVLIEEAEGEQEADGEQQDFSLDYRHVSDVIANYEQLSTGKEQPSKEAAKPGREQEGQKEGEEQTMKEQQERRQQQERKKQKEQLFRQKLLEELQKQRVEAEEQNKKEQQQREQEKKEQEKKEQGKKEQEQRQQEQQKERQKQQQEAQSRQRLQEQKEQEERKLKQEQQEQKEKMEKLLKEQQQKQQQQLEQEQQAKEQQENEKQEKKEQEELQQKPAASFSSLPTVCPHEPCSTADTQGSWCSVCGECRESPHGWGKLTKADQWRFDNLQNEPLANYKSTYEIRSPYISRQISWEDTQQQQQQQSPLDALQRQRSEVEIVHTPAPPSPPSLQAVPPHSLGDRQLSRSPSPLPLRRYPAPLIDTAQRCSSPFGLNAVQGRGSGSATPTPTPTPVPLEAKYTHVPQLEGHNIGLLVRTATEPLQLSMSASSSLLAAAASPLATPRCTSQPPPFDFLLQHGLDPHSEFQSIAAHEDPALPSNSRDFSVNRSFDNVSPRPYVGIEGASSPLNVLCDPVQHLLLFPTVTN